jgi:hypothetical protein
MADKACAVCHRSAVVCRSQSHCDAAADRRMCARRCMGPTSCSRSANSLKGSWTSAQGMQCSMPRHTHVQQGATHRGGGEAVPKASPRARTHACAHKFHVHTRTTQSLACTLAPHSHRTARTRTYTRTLTRTARTHTRTARACTHRMHAHAHPATGAVRCSTAAK